MSEKHENQALLVTVTNFGPEPDLSGDRVVANVIEALPGVARDVWCSGLDGMELCALRGWRSRDCDVPCKSGIYVWEGSVEQCQTLSDITHSWFTHYNWLGAFRPARADDLAKFGLRELEP